MIDSLTLFYFSPTGGTKAAADILCHALAKTVTAVDLADKQLPTLPQPTTDLVVVAAPVFVGRIPAMAMDKLYTLQGAGKSVVALAVYGNRDYDDALLELTDGLRDRGFSLLAASACIAQHSQLPELAAGRPDAADRRSLQDFAAAVLEKLAAADLSPLSIPGNRPYRDRLPASAVPYSTEQCSRCGLCRQVCPTGAITITQQVVTDRDLCILCRACTAHCPTGARIVPPEAAAKLREKLSPYLAVRRENLYFL